jgi:hypothetical protein
LTDARRIENFEISRTPPRFAWRERMQGETPRALGGGDSPMTPDELAGPFLVREGGHPEPIGAPKTVAVGTAALRSFRRLGRMERGDAQRRAIVSYAVRFNRLGHPKFVFLTEPGGHVGGLFDAEPEILWRTESRALVDLQDAWTWAQSLRESGSDYWRGKLLKIVVGPVPDDAELVRLRVPLFAGIPALPAVGHDPVYSDQGKTLIAVRAADWGHHQSFASAILRGCAEWLEGRLFRSIQVDLAPPRGARYTPVGGLAALLLAAALELSGNKSSVRCKRCGDRFFPARPSRAVFCSKNCSNLWHYHHPRPDAPASR